MNDTLPHEWPADVVRVTCTPDGLLLHFPVLRGWRAARRLAAIGLALLLPSLYAAFAYLPTGKSDAAVLVTLALTAAVVYPVIVFGALFVLTALYAVTNSLTVEVDATSIRTVRHVMGLGHSRHSLATAAIGALEPERTAAPRGLGGDALYRLAAIPAAGGPRMIVAEGLPDEILCRALKMLIERHAHIALSVR